MIAPVAIARQTSRSLRDLLRRLINPVTGYVLALVISLGAWATLLSFLI